MSKTVELTSLHSPARNHTYPLSPVASTKLRHCGCSQINNAASAVSVHQHIARLNNSLFLNWGKKVATAFRMLTSDASGYVSVGCFACDLGTEMRFGAEAPYGWCCLKRVKPGNSSQTLMIPFLEWSSVGSGKNI